MDVHFARHNMVRRWSSARHRVSSLSQGQGGCVFVSSAWKASPWPCVLSEQFGQSPWCLTHAWAARVGFCALSAQHRPSVGGRPSPVLEPVLSTLTLSLVQGAVFVLVCDWFILLWCFFHLEMVIM